MNLIATAWVKNESPYLAEWIEFSLIQGFTKFIIYDNKSDDNIAEVLEPYIARGIAEHRFYPPEVTDRNNFWVMQSTLAEFANTDSWLFHHSVDERMFCPDGRKITDILPDYHEFGGLSVGWEEFNSGGAINKEPGLVQDRFTTTCYDRAKHIKTIVRPECAISHEGDPHNFIFKPGFMSVDENKNQVVGPWNTSNPYTMDLIKNHHYRTMSKEEFDNKQLKGLLDHPGGGNRPRNDSFEQWDWCHNQAILGQNTQAQQWSAQVKENLRNTYKAYPNVYKLIKEWYNL